jgi:hypothetical protein
MGLMRNLMPEPPATLLPLEDAAARELASGVDPLKVAGDHPTHSDAWAALAKRALAAGEPVTAYAYARTGYHRGLDQLRRAGWKGSGPVPWSHHPNRGFLRCLHSLSLAAAEIGEADEAARCAQFLKDCDPVAGDALASA